MFKRIHQKLGTAGFIISIVALIAAIGGTALAAGGLTKSQEKQVTKIAKKYAGKNGAPGAAGPAGPAGAAGKEGPAGKNGTNGTNGTNGAPGAPGETGFTESLPPGKTETGTWYVHDEAAAAEEQISAQLPISFPIPLPFPAEPGKAPIFEYAKEGETTTGCKGSYQNPTAEPGYFCVYSFFSFTEVNVKSTNVTDLEEPGESGPSGAGHAARFGSLLRLESAAAGVVSAQGSWAVTAPKE